MTRHKLTAAQARKNLLLLFKEVLRNTSPEDARRLSDGHFEEGKSLRLIIGEMGYDEKNDVPFRWGFEKGDNWRKGKKLRWMPSSSKRIQ